MQIINCFANYIQCTSQFVYLFVMPVRWILLAKTIVCTKGK